MRIVRRLGLAVALAGGVVGFGVGPAQSQGAFVVDCSNVFPGLGGVVVFTPNGDLLGNCYEHVTPEGPGGSSGEPATRVDCDEAIGEGSTGVAVITPSGNTLTNCHVHVHS